MKYKYKDLLTDAAEIRKLTIDEMAAAGYGHIGGSMSICDVLAVLYGRIMRYDADNPALEDRDWLVLSKGHCGPALYAALAYEGFFPKDELSTLNRGGTNLPSHCDRLKTLGIDISTGSLGQGLSLASGVAYGNRMKGLNSTVYCIVGDGELQEGQNWEAVQFIAHRNMNNIVIIVDNNKRQLDGYTEDICRPFSLTEKFKAFGFDAEETDGHNTDRIYDALNNRNHSRPFVLILNTEKGHGCNFAEISGFNHYMVITKDMAESAKAEIDRRLEAEL